eukprot:TRINITY_DN2269_c0_g1_i1.p1 TRINITY_DN2269_c0_g1~~TRINITY_DN2269_c0_g1_i1.p1  ORF type:complete len:229 (-),score=12.36 TRINITY_DN2269_c0_g1_i1:330-1016(-)
MNAKFRVARLKNWRAKLDEKKLFHKIILSTFARADAKAATDSRSSVFQKFLDDFNGNERRTRLRPNGGVVEDQRAELKFHFFTNLSNNDLLASMENNGSDFGQKMRQELNLVQPSKAAPNLQKVRATAIFAGFTISRHFAVGWWANRIQPVPRHSTPFRPKFAPKDLNFSIPDGYILKLRIIDIFVDGNTFSFVLTAWDIWGHVYWRNGNASHNLYTYRVPINFDHGN